MVDLHTLLVGSRPEHAMRNNGPTELAIERYKLRELAEGWPCYRDAYEWENFAPLFHADAPVHTTWSRRMHSRDFIAASQRGMDAGAFIMHRVHGSTTDISPAGARAITKMKATITQRFVLAGAEVDVDVDYRFCFFWEKYDGEWRSRLDRPSPVDPRRVPELDDEKMASYPPGYRYPAYCQEATMGI
ncbi:hypothetical protein K488DRAFT_80091 [Vararia minispora EC-137]|uniref:Uncharacterized protein n=1 Tax=Vararia minispora EC-137 TaxID=1314806 RepID=A0ACB8QCS6_9AGAM|nr:hypothetical protein K488DRAFT_80091 [Vararia minispora EC-137]